VAARLASGDLPDAIADKPRATGHAGDHDDWRVNAEKARHVIKAR
jgi:hypothetical protein